VADANLVQLYGLTVWIFAWVAGQDKSRYGVALTGLDVDGAACLAEVLIDVGQPTGGRILHFVEDYPHPQYVPVKCQRLVQVSYADSDVGNAGCIHD
jgi:hypothetical protein